MIDRLSAPLAPGLAADLARVHADAFAGTGEVWSAAEIAASAAGTGAILFADREARGFILVRAVTDEAEVLTLAVDPRHRRHGLGRALLEAGIAACHAAGATRLFLEVAEDNAAARALYAAAGFAPCGRRPGYYLRGDDTRVAGLILERAL